MTTTTNLFQTGPGGEPLAAGTPRRRFVHVQTFGCQMNVNDTDRILQVLTPFGYAATDDPAQADLILLNTCSVRDKAEQKMMSQLGRLAPLKEYNDDLVLGVAGCVAQQEGERLLQKVPYLDLVFGPDHVGDLPSLLDRVRGSKERVSETTFFKRKDYAFIEAEPPAEVRVSEFVTIMKGCDKVCSFCIVPFTRGREVSKDADMVVREVERLVAAGTREVTLLGQNVNSYGKDLRGDRVPTFAQLLRRVDAIPGLERLRFTTSHPMDAIDDLIACFSDLRTLCEYFHLPVQSGSDRVLRAMRRSYTREGYLEKVAKLRARCPGIALSTDIIVGFPG
ncbi:MAG: tRNA (N6-isopentenyl adenosine(37)-C2)-methylthiotransferase MiaB, partial [Myxococcales bacterium]|nr:tRNA (N6-isopentenyl adenosine(37)-C2)-methylthiotransferase MiaB [Myxococcales bacterium]